MSKLTTSDLVNLSNETSTVNTINNNFTATEVAMENTLSRDGTSPNAMGADLDLDQHRILNLPTPTAPTDVVRLQDLTLTYLANTTLSPTPTVGDAHKIIKINTAGTAYTFSGVLIDASNNVTIPATSNLVLTQGNLTLTNGYFDFKEISVPANPAADVYRLYIKDNGGVTTLYARDSAGLETMLSVQPASASDMETATSVTTRVTPGIMHRHPGMPKAWAKVTGTTSPVLTSNYGFASVSRPALGRILLTLSTAMSSANYCIQATVERAATALTVANTLKCSVRNATPTTTTFELECMDSTATTNVAVDPTSWFVTVWGDQ